MAESDDGLSAFIDLSDPEAEGYPKDDLHRFPKDMAGPTPRDVVYKDRDGKDVPVPCFEIGLVLAGAVSAGAYTAGVLDYLIEALDRWEYAKEQDALQHGTAFEKWSVPPHAVRIKVVAGASAGSVCAALLAVAGQRRFRPVRATPGNRKGPDAHRADNPFYDLWVNRLDIREMLNTGDIRPGMKLGELRSLLNSGVVSSAADAALDDHPDAEGMFPEVRRYLADPLRIALSVANLNGIPYCYRFEGLEGARFATTRHADSMRFDVHTTTAPPAPGQGEGGVYTVAGRPAHNDPWKRLAGAALASGAFPIAFAPVKLKKGADDYRFDLRLRADMGEAPAVGYSRQARLSAGFATVSGAFAPEFDTVDGGTMNNQPFQYARQVLTGPLGELEDREANAPGDDGDVARKAIVIIDPFPASAKDAARDGKDVNVGSAAGKLLRAWINQARYDANDLALAADPNVYSRFMLSPMRARMDGANGSPGSTALGQEAIASGALEGFSGFLSRRYRHHDFLLGRRNAENFLRNYFALPEGNSLFDDAWWKGLTPEQQAEHRTLTAEPGKAKETERLIIPRIARADDKPFEHWHPDRRDPSEEVRKRFVRQALDELSPIWPGAVPGSGFRASEISGLLQGRADAVLKLVTAEFGKGVPGFVLALLRKAVRNRLVEKAEKALDEAVEAHGLWEADR